MTNAVTYFIDLGSTEENNVRLSVLNPRLPEFDAFRCLNNSSIYSCNSSIN